MAPASTQTATRRGRTPAAKDIFWTGTIPAYEAIASNNAWGFDLKITGLDGQQELLSQACPIAMGVARSMLMDLHRLPITNGKASVQNTIAPSILPVAASSANGSSSPSGQRRTNRGTAVGRRTRRTSSSTSGSDNSTS